MLGRLRKINRTLADFGIGRREIAWIAFTGILCAALEGFGVGLLFPVLDFIEKGPAAYVQGTPVGVWRFILSVTSMLGLQPTLAVLLLIAFVPILARQVVRYLHQIAVHAVRIRGIAMLRRQGYEAFLHANLPFFLTEGQGRLLNALISETERGGTAVGQLVKAWNAGTLVVVYIMLLFWLSPIVAPVALLVMGAVMLLVRMLVTKSVTLGRRLSNLYEALHSLIGERLAGIRLVELMGQEQEESRKLGGILERLSKTSLAIVRGQEVIEVSVEPLLMLGAFVMLYVAVVNFGLTLANLGIFLFVFVRLLPLITQINVARQHIGANAGSLHHVQELVERAKIANSIVGGLQWFMGLRQEIEFANVSFSYPDRDDAGWALRDISFRARKGDLLAIVGRSGAGKSTLLDLIPRLREVTAGVIRLDGVPIQAFELKSLRSKIGMVDQHGFLFNDTVRSNIAYGLPDVTQEQIEEAARKAHAQEFIHAMPQGYDTVIGDRGVRLSGGQRQRLALARILLQDPDILLLDEPTSALDQESERYIQGALECLRRDKVVIVIAHRLSTIRQADQILVLDEGRIVERGDHQTLLSMHWGVYKQLFDLQIHV